MGMKKILLLCLLGVGVCWGGDAGAASSLERELQGFVGENDAYIGRRFKSRFPSLYGRLVSICCLKDGGKVSEVRWYTRGGPRGDAPCRAIFYSREGKVVRVEVVGEGCAR